MTSVIAAAAAAAATSTQPPTPDHARLSVGEIEDCIINSGPIFHLLPPSARSASGAVAFTLRPPTIDNDDAFLATFGLRVYTEWLKTSPSQQPGCIDPVPFSSPSLSYSQATGCFRLDVTRDPNFSETAAAAAAADLRKLLDSLADVALREATKQHLTEGGDERLHLTTSGGTGNKYFCPPHPVPDSVVIRGTCTCSPPSRRAFDAACAKLEDIWNAVEALDFAYEDVRNRISAALAIQTRHHIVLHPSGTDAEFTPLLLGANQARSLGCSGILNVVTGVGEVGSNTPHAAGGCHFSKYLPNGGETDISKPIVDDSEFPEGIRTLELPARDVTNGTFLADFDNLALAAVEEAVSSLEKPFVIMHAVDGSKLGSRITTRSLVTEIQSRFGGKGEEEEQRVLVVLDACQGRTDTEELDWYLSRGAVVLITASKFYSAPGFCGMAVIPDSIADSFKYDTDTDNMKECRVPEGMADYLGRYQVPSSLKALRSALPAKPVNIGLLLRWVCGVAEMERMSRVGARARLGIRNWAGGVRELIRREFDGRLELMPETSSASGQASQLGGVNSIIPFKLFGRKENEKTPLGTAPLKRIHQWLTADVSGLLPESASTDERETVAFRCFIGQPVDLGSFAILRLAIGAALASELGEDPGVLEMALAEDRRILNKIVVLLKYHGEM